MSQYAAPTSAKIPVVALVGNPNSGKSTLFNALTGLRQKIGNYAGVTVERKEGIFLTQHGKPMLLMDLPGAYSLSPTAPDEEILRDALLGTQEEVPHLDGIVCIADATQLERHLFLIYQVLELGLPTMLALTMADQARERKIAIDLGGLSQALGVPVVIVQSNAPKTLTALKVTLSNFIPTAQPHTVKRLQGTKAEKIAQRHAIVRSLCERFVRRNRPGHVSLTERVDRILLHRLWGTFFLFAILTGLFYSIFVVAETPKGWIEDSIDGANALVTYHLSPGLLRDLLTKGVLTGVGAVLAFIPQIACLLLFIGLLESTGYMARAAFILDRVMQRVGLQGKSFIPMLSSYACAIPGIMATRTIDCPRDRLATILIAPWASCSARLPVYAVMIATIAPTEGFSHLTRALILLITYTLGTVSAFAMAWILKKTLLTGGTTSVAALMELPPYRLPRLSDLLWDVYVRTKSFVVNAGTVILALSMLMWLALSHPMRPDLSASEALANSYGGRLGKFIEPALQPLGFDWKIGIGLITSFAAREVFASTMAIVYNAEGTSPEDIAGLEGVLRKQKRPNGLAVFTPLVCLSLMVFYIYAHQCLSTMAAVRRETRTWRWPLFQFGYMTAVAYCACWLVYQTGLLIGFS